jgi:bifunctional DNA-binding transcriptional regulator/antitoxin component of YhaV-PrlF toxin-antitoxin module
MQSANPNFITQCEEDEDGNLILNFPDELLEAMGWGEGTCLDIDVVGNGIVLREVELPDDSGEEGPS